MSDYRTGLLKRDVSAAMETGQLTYAQELDPDIRSMLKAGLMRLV